MPSYITSGDLTSNQLAFCGGLAGVVSRFVIAPLDVVKIRMQLQTHSTLVKPQDVKYSGVIQTLETVAKEEGIRGLYKGNMPAEYLYLSYTMIEFWSYKELEQVVDKYRIPETLKAFGCGMIAGCIATASTYPFDLLRTRFAMENSKKRHTVLQAIATIYRQEGYVGFYRGLWPAVIQIMPYMGLLFSSYDVFSKNLKKLRDSETLSSNYKSTHDMISGALSGITSKIAVYPFDLVRKRLQVQGKSVSWYICMLNVAKQEGVKSLYKGLVPSLVKIAPANAVTFMVFERTKEVLLKFK